MHFVWKFCLDHKHIGPFARGISRLVSLCFVSLCLPGKCPSGSSFSFSFSSLVLGLVLLLVSLNSMEQVVQMAAESCLLRPSKRMTLDHECAHSPSSASKSFFELVVELVSRFTLLPLIVSIPSQALSIYSPSFPPPILFQTLPRAKTVIRHSLAYYLRILPTHTASHVGRKPPNLLLQAQLR